MDTPTVTANEMFVNYWNLLLASTILAVIIFIPYIGKLHKEGRSGISKFGNEYIPQFEIDSIAKSFLPEIHKFFESEEGKREFEEWKKENCK